MSYYLPKSIFANRPKVFYYSSGRIEEEGKFDEHIGR